MKMKVMLFAALSEYAEGGVIFQVSEVDMSAHFGQKVWEGEFDFPVKHLKREDLIPGEIARLRQEQQTIRVDAEEKVQRVEQQIGKLLAIENGSGN